MANKKNKSYVDVQVVNQSRVKPRERLLIRVVFFTLSVLVAYYVGYFKGEQDFYRFKDIVKDQKLEIDLLSNQLQTQKQQNQILQHGLEVQRTATDKVRKSNIELNNQIGQLSADINFYKGVMAPSDTKKGVNVERLDLVYDDTKSKASFELVLARSIAKQQSRGFVSGEIMLLVEGVNLNNQSKQIQLDILNSSSKKPSSFKFRYYQSISGQFLIPDGLKPSKLIVKIKTSGKAREQVYDWSQLLVEL